MFKKHININKKIKLSIWDKISIFYNFYVRKVHQSKIYIIDLAYLAYLQGVGQQKRAER